MTTFYDPNTMLTAILREHDKAESDRAMYERMARRSLSGSSLHTLNMELSQAKRDAFAWTLATIAGNLGIVGRDWMDKLRQLARTGGIE